MKRDFTGYYAPTEEEYQKLWRDGLIALDTNVLLNLYRLPATARDELIALLELLKERLWIPYQVALEFQKRRLSVISAERKVTEDALSDANELFEALRKKVSTLQIDKRGVGVDVKSLLAELKAANDKLIGAIDTVHKSQLDISANDIVRDRLDFLLNEKIGIQPNSQAELDKLIEDGQQRYDRKIPPGFADADKEKNPNDAEFYHDGLVYQRKFGDLIVWRQLVQHVKKHGIKAVLFITADRKEDWWWREKGKTIGPRPELSREIAQTGEVDLFWMYSSDQFLENAKRFTNAEVSDSSVTELKDVARNTLDLTIDDTYREIKQDYHQQNLENRLREIVIIERAVFDWLSEIYPVINLSSGFPDFIAQTKYGPHGFEIKYLRSFNPMLDLNEIISTVMKGYVEVDEGRLSGITIIIVTKKENLLPIQGSNRNAVLERRLVTLMIRYPISEIVVGYITERNEFLPVVTQRGRQTWSGAPEQA